MQRAIELDEPGVFNKAGERTTVLTFREMKAGDLKIFDNEKTGEVEKMIHLMAVLTNCTPKTIEDLPIEAFSQGMEVMADFLKPFADMRRRMTLMAVAASAGEQVKTPSGTST